MILGEKPYTVTIRKASDSKIMGGKRGSEFGARLKMEFYVSAVNFINLSSKSHYSPQLAGVRGLSTPGSRAFPTSQHSGQSLA